MLNSDKHILVFIDWYLPGYRAGGPVQSVANLISHLSSDYRFSVVTRDTDYCESTPYPDVKSDIWNTMEDGTRVFYFSKKNLTISNMQRLIRSESFRFAYINGIYSPYFSILPLWLLRNNKSVEKVVASRGMLAGSAIAIKSTKKKLFLTAAKLTGLYNRVTFHATNQTEANHIKDEISGKAVVKVAPNMAAKEIVCGRSQREKKSGILKMINISRIAREKNIHFALEILRHIQGEIIYDIYGVVYDKEYLDDCQQLINGLPENVKVTIKGGIDKNLIQSCLSNYHFLFFPSLGENFGHVVLESLSTGCPVIISDKTPWRDLSAQKAGWDIPLDDRNAFINVINFALNMNQEEYDILSEGATEYAGKFIDNPGLIEMNRNIFQ